MAIRSSSAAALDEVAAATYGRLFHALSDPSRLEILQHLASGPHRVRDLVDHMGFAQSTVSKHLSCLRECGLVTVRTQGRASWFALAEPDRLADVLRAAEALLFSTGNQVSLCRQLMGTATPGEA